MQDKNQVFADQRGLAISRLTRVTEIISPGNIVS